VEWSELPISRNLFLVRPAAPETERRVAKIGGIMTVAIHTQHTRAQDSILPRYLRQVNAFPLLESAEERTLAQQAQGEDVAAIARLTTSHLRLVTKVAKSYSKFGLPMNELIAEGTLGMVRAVRRFDPDRGCRLSSFAAWWIRAAIQEYVLRNWSMVRIGTTRGQKKLFFNLRHIKSQIGALEKGRLAPEQIDSIVRTLRVPAAEVVLVNDRLAGSDLSLNAPLATEGGGELQDWLVDERPTPETFVADSEELHHRRRLLCEALTELSARERNILVQRRLKEEPATLDELSERYDISAERVRQIELAAYEKLKGSVLRASRQSRPRPVSSASGSKVPAASKAMSMAAARRPAPFTAAGGLVP
jgi:RNA polymerase sigma-32 factor